MIWHRTFGLPPPHPHSPQISNRIFVDQLHPAAMVLPTTAAHVVTALDIANTYGVKVAVRSSVGHSYIGASTSDGIVLCLQKMTNLVASSMQHPTDPTRTVFQVRCNTGKALAQTVAQCSGCTYRIPLTTSQTRPWYSLCTHCTLVRSFMQ